MSTTIEIPDDLYAKVTEEAQLLGVAPDVVVRNAIRAAIEVRPKQQPPQRIQFPLVRTHLTGSLPAGFVREVDQELTLLQDARSARERM